MPAVNVPSVNAAMPLALTGCEPMVTAPSRKLTTPLREPPCTPVVTIAEKVVLSPNTVGFFDDDKAVEVVPSTTC